MNSEQIPMLYHHQTLTNATIFNYKDYKAFYNITVNLITYTSYEQTITCFMFCVISIIEKFSVLHFKLRTILSIYNVPIEEQHV